MIKKQESTVFANGISLALAFSSLAAIANAASCPASAPEGYKWLSGYVDEFRATGTVSSWFADSRAQFPDDIALLGLQAYFDTDGDITAARQLFLERGGSDEAFSIAMACAQIKQ
ncbi:hypothetical protein [Meridianimarinicoccus aquatilis]|uniref:Lipoprotein n=1 Tax=Meridianimarinicoccus aquatilis TaxID=2552766 RepID=A0A4R6B2X4_9RHOB|nr:hypothetical protein [Fluviibacterium aquatile]TDL90524.1 hypothetical protein E2L05_05340 [Fluviibacterium aquatile]